MKPEGYRCYPFHLVLATVALCILSLALPIMTLQVYDRILPNPDSGTLPILMAGVAVAVLLEAALRVARSWLIGWNGAVYEHRLGVKAMEHVLSSDLSKAGRIGTGEFLQRVGGISRIKDFFNGYALVTLTEAAFIPLFLGIIFYIAAPLAIIPALLLCAFTLITLRQGRLMRREAEKRDTDDEKRYDFLIECLKGIHTVKAFALENLFARKYEALQEKSGLGSYHTAQAATASFNAGTTLSHLMMATVMTAGALFVLSGEVTTGALIATLQLSGRLMQPVQRTLVLWAKYQDYRLAHEKLGGIFALPLQKSDHTLNPPSQAGNLVLKDVSFGTILKAINLNIKPGETIAIRGAAGSGKTALMEIIAGLYPPDSGEILLDSVPLHAFSAEDLVRRIGYMPAEGAIFRGSIRENITCFGHADAEMAREVAGMLAVDRDVARLQFGFDTMLQANGADQVPLGLRQRIAMTRALACRPKIILFDDADRALDREGYALAFSLLAKLGRETSMLLVTEDANITALAHRHYRLEDGVLHEIPELQERKFAS